MKSGATTSFSLVSTSVSVLGVAVVDAKRRPWGKTEHKIPQTLKKNIMQTVEQIQDRMRQPVKSAGQNVVLFWGFF